MHDLIQYLHKRSEWRNINAIFNEWSNIRACCQQLRAFVEVYFSYSSCILAYVSFAIPYYKTVYEFEWIWLFAERYLASISAQ